MPAPVSERLRTPWFFKLGVRLRATFACLTAGHVVVAWSPRFRRGDRVAFMGLDQKLIHQAESAANFLAQRLSLEASVQGLCAEVEEGECD